MSQVGTVPKGVPKISLKKEQDNHVGVMPKEVISGQQNWLQKLFRQAWIDVKDSDYFE